MLQELVILWLLALVSKVISFKECIRHKWFDWTFWLNGCCINIGCKHLVSRGKMWMGHRLHILIWDFKLLLRNYITQRKFWCLPVGFILKKYMILFHANTSEVHKKAKTKTNKQKSYHLEAKRRTEQKGRKNYIYLKIDIDRYIDS